jgi:uncharacterized protein YgiM (DUF1202 family)
MYRHGRVAFIAVGCAAILGAMLLIPGEEQVAVAEVRAAVGEPSQETIAAIDALLGSDRTEVAAPQQVAATPSITEADRNLLTAALSAPQTDLEGAPLVDPDLRPDTIGASAVNLRAGPSTATATVTVLQPGQAVRTGEMDGGWVEVTLEDGTTGWVYSRYLASSPAAHEAAAPAEKAATRTAKAVVKGGNGALEGRTARIEASLTARAQPEGGSRSVFRTEPGERVRILDVRGNWLRIVTADGSSGWIERAG